MKDLVSRKSMMNQTLVRCSTVRSATLPLDILASEILPRLPPTSLLRFKCVNKFFYYHISSTQFIKRQLNHSLSSGHNRPLIFFISHGALYNFLYFLDADRPDSPARFIVLPPPFRATNIYVELVGSCNGLLCIMSTLPLDRKDMYCFLILNPSTGKVLANITLASEDSDSKCLYGFGYDTSSDDYKLVVFEYYLVSSRHNPDSYYKKVLIYSLRSGFWRCIDHSYYGDRNNADLPSSLSPCVLIHNHLMHWLLFSCNSLLYPKSLAIVCFNYQNEQWSADVPLPDVDEYDFHGALGSGCVSLGVLDGCLCISGSSHVDKLRMWIMKEYGVQSSWTKMYIDIPHNHRFHTFFPSEHAATKELVLADNQPDKSGEQTFIWCNIEDKTTKTLQFTRLPCGVQSERLLCIPSLATAVEGHNKSLNEAMGVRMMVDREVETITGGSTRVAGRGRDRDPWAEPRG